ncbi:MAG: gluconate 2-dehydrogenase gamma chain [Pseudomonadota bacterium]|nr:gluconate 2-dehydrogenase gamma chain [Pseudomonadota bacterium]
MNNNNGFILRRREFLLLLTSLATLSPGRLFSANNQQTITQYHDEPWITLDTVFEHLFPAVDGAPGAREIRVIAYMQTMLNAPDADPEDMTFINKGAGWLNDLSQTEYKHPFAALDENTRENILRKIETSEAGERWLSVLLTNLLEALMSDPVYGSNPDGIGWKWLQHPAGYPLPTDDHMYYKISKKFKG